MPVSAGGQTQSQSQVQTQPHGVLHGYDPGGMFCEMSRPGQPTHPPLPLLLPRLAALPIGSLRHPILPDVDTRICIEPDALACTLGRPSNNLPKRYNLCGGTAALERLDQLNGMLTHHNVADLAARRLSPFLDYVQREIAALHGDIIAGFCSG